MNGIIENLLQDNVKIEFDTEEEKEKILGILPNEFQAQVEGNEIIISFEKEEIEATAYSYRGGGMYLQKIDKIDSIRKIKATLKTPELTRKIADFKSKVHQVKAEIYKADTERYNRGKIMATYNLLKFFHWLNKTGEIEILNEKMLGDGDYDYYFTLKSDYKYKGEEEIHNIYGKENEEKTYGDRILGMYKEHIEKLKESGEYYIEGSLVPKYEYAGKDRIYYGQGKGVITKDGKASLTFESDTVVKGYFTAEERKWCKSKIEPIIYVAMQNNDKGYIELPQEECLIRSS